MEKINRRMVTGAAFLIVLGIVMYYCHLTGLLRNCTARGIKEYVSSFGVFGPLVYMILFSVIPSGSIIAIAGGMAFGMYLGTVYTTIGAVIGATSAFYISRLLGRDFVEKLLKNKMQKFEDGIEKSGFLLILILRLIPIVPFNVISYGAGLTKIKYGDYITATMIGIVPGVIVFTNLGDKALNVRSPQFLFALGILVFLVAGSCVLKKRVSLEDLQSKLISARKSS